jgi:hypothetical protein
MNAAAQSLGRLGGLAKSKAKAEASRSNGKLGGRPKKKKRVARRQNKTKTPGVGLRRDGPGVTLHACGLAASANTPTPPRPTLMRASKIGSRSQPAS